MNPSSGFAQISDPIFTPMTATGAPPSAPVPGTTTTISGGYGGSSGGNLSLNIPGLNFGGGAGSAGGLGLNFDFGANPTAAAATSYQFLQNTNATDQGFLAQTIAGTQGFLTNMTGPIVGAATAQINANTTALPQIYSNMFTLGQQGIAGANATAANAIAAQQATSQASIASSNASANSGGCYITTAVCESEGMADDCDILQTLRAFRDRYVSREKISEYYAKAPAIVARIKSQPSAKRRLRSIYLLYILPAYFAIKAGDDKGAMRIYSEGTAYAERVAYG